MIGNDIMAGLVVEPGDTLIILVNPHTSEDVARRIKEELTGDLPDGAKVRIVGANGLAVIKAG